MEYGIDGRWFDVYIKRCFELRGFSELKHTDRGWVLTREYPETTWYVIRRARTVADWREGRRWIMFIGVTVNAGPHLIRTLFNSHDVQETQTEVRFNAFQFSPGIEFGVPPESDSFPEDEGSDRYLQYGADVLDLEGSIPIAERCRAITELAERVSKVADTTSTLKQLRDFLSVFSMRHYTEDGVAWFDPKGEFYHTPLGELKEQYG